MSSIKKFFLGAALAVGALTMSAAPAQAARIGFYVGARAVAIPACPGPGYAWVGGYWNNGYWVPGYWNFVGVRGGVASQRERGSRDDPQADDSLDGYGHQQLSACTGGAPGQSVGQPQAVERRERQRRDQTGGDANRE